MARLFRIIVFSALLALALALAPAVALAQGGTTTSAGDQQYVDPLTGTTPAASAPSSTPSSPAPAASSSSSSPGATPTSSSPPSASSSTDAPSSSSKPAAAQGSGNALPFTGLNLGACLAVAVVLLGAGIVLRRVTRRA